MGVACCRAPSPREVITMRSFTHAPGTRFYAGVGLHATSLFTGAKRASPCDDIPMSLDLESDGDVVGRSPGSPPQLRMATDPGTDAYRDRPGPGPWHSRPALRSGAARVRRSVGCGSSSGADARVR